MNEVLSLKQAILATLHYFDLLDFAPTAAELADFLYGWSAPVEVIEAQLAKMEDVAHAHGFYFLKGRQSLAEMRKERALLNKKLWKKVRQCGWMLSLCPFVKMVAVCNSLAYENVKPESDIDLFVVTKTGHLATARFFMKVLTQIFGVRVHHNKIAGRFCLSFFVSESAMNLEKLAHDFDPHLAYFVATMRPVCGEETYVEFLRVNNEWISRYFKRPLKPKLEYLQRHPIVGVFSRVLESILSIFGSVIEPFLGKHQGKKDTERKKMFPNSKGIVTNKDVFKFHENDPREEIAQDFEQRLNPKT